MDITIMQMSQNFMVINLIGMAALFVLMGILISAIGGGKTTAKEAVSKSGNMSEVTAAITAAVNEYRKNN